VGDEAVNGGWPPHAHFQLNTELDLGGWRGDYPGVAAVADWPAYHVLCPDANLLLRCPWVRPVGWEAGAGAASAEHERGTPPSLPDAGAAFRGRVVGVRVCS
jgi:hypothetical protein